MKPTATLKLVMAVRKKLKMTLIKIIKLLNKWNTTNNFAGNTDRVAQLEKAKGKFLIPVPYDGNQYLG